MRIGLTRLERNAAYDDGEAERLHRVPGHQHHDFADQPVDAFYGAQKELIRGRVAEQEVRRECRAAAVTVERRGG